MNEDAELLSRYAADRSEAAFAEFTGRHVDLVYSAAFRLMNGDAPAAQDVTQQVFTEAARQAQRLARHPAIVGWLYTTTRHLALRHHRTEQRRKAREQEAHAMNELLHDDSPPPAWDQLRPVIEDVMHELGDDDRLAVLLRYFQNKTLREVGEALSLSENAARMRVDRAVDKLRGKLARRGVTTTAAALATLVAAHAVQAAPAGFAAAVSAGAVVGSAAAHASTLITATQTLAMTTLQKTIIVTSLAAAVGTGIFAVHQGTQLRGRIQTLKQEQAPLAARIQQLEQERNDATGRVAALLDENTQLKAGRNEAEVLKLRGKVGQLRQELADAENKSNAPSSGLAKLMSDPSMKAYIRQAQKEKLKSFYDDLIKELNLTPEQTDAFVELLTDIASRSMDRDIAAAQEKPVPAEPPNGNGPQLGAVLGDAGLVRFKEYSKQLPARTTIKLLDQQLGDRPITAEQKNRLIQIIGSEPENLTRGIMGGPDKAFMGSQADIDQFLAEVAASNQRISEHAQAVLTPDQLAALDEILAKGIESRKLQGAALFQQH